MIYSDLKDREAYRLLFPNYPDVLDVPQLYSVSVSKPLTNCFGMGKSLTYGSDAHIGFLSVISSHTFKNAVCRKKKGVFHLKEQSRPGKIEVSIS